MVLKCCICSKEYKGHGNSPIGATDWEGRPIIWSKTDRCCDDCYLEVVIPQRINTAIKKENERKK